MEGTDGYVVCRWLVVSRLSSGWDSSAGLHTMATALLTFTGAPPAFGCTS